MVTSPSRNSPPVSINNEPSTDNHRRLSMARLTTSPFQSNSLSSSFTNSNNTISNTNTLLQPTNGSRFKRNSNGSSFYSEDRFSPSNTPRGRTQNLPHPKSLLGGSSLINSTTTTNNNTSTNLPNNHSNTAIESGSNSSNSIHDDELFSNLPATASSNNPLDDPNILRNLSKHLATDSSDSALKLQGGDITRDFYTLPNKKASSLKRSKSFSSLENTLNSPEDNDNEIVGTGIDGAHGRRDSTVSSLRLPGGFRRDFLMNRAAMDSKFGHKLERPTFLTSNFLEFLSIYGHFAGEDLEDEDFIACNYGDLNKLPDEETTPLMYNRQHQQYLQQRQSQRQKLTKPKGTASTLKSFFLLLKSFIGTGILFLPKAFYNGGLLFCICVLLFFGILSYWCYLILVYAKEATGVSSFGDIGLKLYGKPMKFLILSSIILSQIGFVAAYTVFTAENLKSFLNTVFDIEVSIATLVVIEGIILTPMSLIRNITKLSLAALIANIFILSGLVTIVYYTTEDLITYGPAEISNFNSDNWSLFIGVAIFAFEGIGLIIPVQESMKYPEQYPKVLFAVIAVCSVLFVSIGSLGYYTYGSSIETVIILNLPKTLAVSSIQFFYALAIMLSAPIQLLPAIRIIESRIFKRQESGKLNIKVKWYKNIFRTLMVILTSLIAYFGSDNLDQFVSFVGSFACIPLVYMYPPMLHYKSVAHSKKMKALDIFLILLGGVAMVYTTYQIVT